MTKLSVYMYNMINVLRRMGVDWRDRRLIGNLYMGQKIRVKIDGEFSEPRSIGRGVRQGYPLSPILFNLYIEELVREALQDSEEGVKVGGKLIKALRFADDQAMVAGKEDDLQRMMDRLNKTTTEYGMKINTKKTKVMKIRRIEEEKNMKITRRRRNRTGHRILLLGKPDIKCWLEHLSIS